MNSPRYVCPASLIVFSFVIAAVSCSVLAAPARGARREAARSRWASLYGKLPLRFEAVQGQSDGKVKYLARGAGYALFLSDGEAVMRLERSSGMNRPGMASAVLRMKVVGGDGRAEAKGERELEGKSNYFIGRDQGGWRTGVATYGQVRYRGVYHGVDLVYYGNQEQLEYDFVVGPGGRPEKIEMQIAEEGATRRGLEIGRDGDLVVKVEGGEVRFHRPVVYETGSAEAGSGTGAAERVAVDGRWVLKGRNRVGFEVGSYDRRKTLVIDPALSYSTYLGGSGSDYGYNMAIDASGNAFVVGTTASSNFPTHNPLQPYGGNTDTFVAEINPTGTGLIYCTFLGGKGTDFASYMALNSAGNVYVVGRTGSSDFPVTAGSYQTVLGGHTNGFVTELNPTGSALVFSTFIGGSVDDQINTITLAPSGNIYVAGWTASTNFPTTPGAFQTTYGGRTDAFVSELASSGSSLVYSTLLGGGNNDNRAFGIARDVSGNAYVVGYTSSKSFPTTPGAFQTTYGGGANDAFIAEVNPTGSALVYSTYLGGTGIDFLWADAVDSKGGIYFTGQSSSPNYPVTAGAFQATCPGTCTSNHVVIGKLNPLASKLSYSTFLGGSGEEEAYALAIDSAGDAYVTGRTSSVNFPTTPGAFQPSKSTGFDAFVTEINPAGTSLIYSSFLGGNSTETGLGIATDKLGNAYVIGRTYSSTFPTTAGAIQTTFGGGIKDAFVSKFPLADPAWPRTLDFGNLTLGSSSSPRNLTFSNTSLFTINISSIAIAGTAAGDFSQVSTCGATLAAGTSCTVSVTFTPTAAGIRTAAVNIVDDAPNSPQTVSLTGAATLPVALSPASLAFMAQVVNTTSLGKAVTLTNNTGAPLTFNSITVTGQFAQTNDCGTSIPANTSCTITVVFDPKTKGTLTGVLSVSDNGPFSPQTVSLSGVGTFISLSPASLNFGNQATGTSSAPQTITLTNKGGVSVSITGIAITGTGAASFSQTTTCGSTVPALGSCSFSVTFTPQAIGKASAALAVSDNGGGGTQKASLLGNGN
jgi:hypothetical protein